MITSAIRIHSFLIPMLSCFTLNAIAGPEPLPVSYTVDTARVVHQINNNIYGQFLEHICNSIHGGLWGNLVLNSSLEPNPGQDNLWYSEGTVIGLKRPATDNRVTFGERNWTDYELTLEAKKEQGGEGFIVLFRVAGRSRYYWCNFGGWRNSQHGIEKNRGQLGERAAGSIETGRWYRVTIRCEGPRYQVWLDDEKILDITDRHDPVLHGKVGLSSWGTQATFRNIAVKTLDGKTLYTGLPSETELATSPPYWDYYGSGTFDTDPDNARGSAFSLKIDNTDREAETGIVQQPLCLRAGETYHGSVFLKGNAPAGVRISVSDQQGTIVAQKIIKPVGQVWKNYRFAFSPQKTVENAVLRVGLPRKGTVWVDLLTLFSESALDCGGYRPDLLEAVKELLPATIRYPGGCFASQYHWKDAVGQQMDRTVHPHVIWGDRDMNEYGSDEFLRMCELVGAEAVLVINVNQGIQNALDWIEYCNGPVTSVWGSMRARNGRPEPYNVQYWEIDNETWGMGTQRYARIVSEFSQAIREKYPELTLIACGAYAYDDGPSNCDGWDKAIIDRAGNDFDYISPHYYNGLTHRADYVDDPRSYEAHLKQVGEYIRTSVNPDIKIYVSEWNIMSTDWRAGLYAGSILNGFERIGDVVTMACPALWLRRSWATMWDNALINFDHRTWFPAPNYVVMKLWRDHYAPNLLALDGPERPLNITATKSADGKTVYIKAVNPERYPVDARLRLNGIAGTPGATFLIVNPGDEKARNTLDNPRAVAPAPAEVSCSGDTVRFRMPPLSAGVVTLE